ncbi:MAG TPA: NUDIX domain-containing protein [Chloroflexota bacterium]|jgi:8-oxo-dGTP pyrophosphatase MutT (NUDIX family)|nr:NUDIX domain-containing protein [Chloroflexota bacterium]
MLDGYVARGEREVVDLERIRRLIESGDPWSRELPLHVTGSAIVVHPPTSRVLLRWHERQQAWLQVGGHADPGESDPFNVALREAAEETGLQDLRVWPPSDQRPQPIHVAVVPVPAGRGEPAHEHADVRFALATSTPERIRAESKKAALEWLTIEQALARTVEDNLRESLTRVAAMLA